MMTGGALPSLLAVTVERLLEQEDLDLEYKAARSGLPVSLWETVSAFANTAGGWIVLGVEQTDAGFNVAGVANATVVLGNLNSTLRNPGKISYPPCGASDASLDTIDGKQVIVLRVPAAPRGARPVYINGQRYGGTYVRRGDGDHRCTPQEVDRMIREAGQGSADATVLANFGLSDLDRDSLVAFRQRFSTHDPGSALNGYDDIAFLRALGAYASVRETKQEGLTVAGLMMFGRPGTIREFRAHHVIDYRLLPMNPAVGERWDDHLYWDGNLFGAFTAIYPRLVSDLRIPFHMQGPTRVDETPAHAAIREALVNLLVHADYGEPVASLIEHSSQGYLFRNPGDSRIPYADIGAGNRSDPRNPRLVDMFRRIGLAEDAGTGIAKIIGAWKRAGFQPPDIDPGTERYEFSLVLRPVHFLSADDLVWLRSVGDSWTEPEQLALAMARSQGGVDNRSLRELTGQHPAEVTPVLGRLRDRGYLQLVGGKRGAHYLLSPALLSSVVFTDAQAPSAEIGADVDSNDPDGQQLRLLDTGLSLLDSETSLLGKGHSSLDSEPDVQQSGEWSSEVEAELEGVAVEVRARRRLAPPVLAAIIVRLCSIAPLSAHELAELLARGDAHIRVALRPPLESGSLTYLYPEQPHHPRQKYVAVPAASALDQRPSTPDPTATEVSE